MNTKTHFVIRIPQFALALALLSTLNTQLSTTFAQGTTFTYQGHLNDGGNPATGIYDLRFTIYDSLSGGSIVAGPLTNAATGVSNGLFTVALDFGSSPFSAGAARWLNIDVQTNGGGGFATLSPRQPLTPTPYAIHAADSATLGGQGSAAYVAKTGDTMSGTLGAPSLQILAPGDLTVINVGPQGGGGSDLRLDRSSTAYSSQIRLNTAGSTDFTLGTDQGSAGPSDLSIYDYGAGKNVLTILKANGNVGIGTNNPQSALHVAGTVTADGFNGSGAGLTGVVATSLPAGALSAPASIVGTNVTAAPNTSYVATNASTTTITLPTTANVGDVVQVSGAGAGGWQVPGTNIYGHVTQEITWTAQAGAPSTLWQSVASSADGTHLVAAEYEGQLYTSTDSGVTWTAQSGAPSANWTSVASSSDGSHLVAVANSGQIYTSANSGTNWTAQAGAPSAYWLSVASSSDGSHLVAVVSGGQIYTSTNSGTNWTAQVGAPSTNWYSVASSLDGTHLVAVVNGGQIYTSTDSGTNWTAQDGAPSASWSSVASSADGTHLVAGVNGGGIFTSANSGGSWTTTGAPSGGWNSVASSSDGSHLVAVVSGGQIYTSTNSGTNWTAQVGAPSASWSSVASSADGTHLVAVVQYGQIYTTDSTGVTTVTPVNGSPGSSQQFQYIGGGVWQPVQATGTWSANGTNLYYNGGNVGIGTATPAHLLVVGGSVSPAYCDGSTWANGSDRNSKEAFAAISPRTVLEKVSALPITEWKYKAEADGTRHLGPVAQDFHSAFGLNGADDRHIATVDEEGVALAAIQGLNQKVEDKDAKIKELEARLEKLERLLSAKNGGGQ